MASLTSVLWRGPPSTAATAANAIGVLCRPRPFPSSATASASASPSACLLSPPSRQSSNRPNTKRPLPTAWFRLQLLEVTKPVHTPKHPTTEHLWRDCPKREDELASEAKKVPNDWEMLYVRQMEEYLRESKMVGIFHANSVKLRPAKRAWQAARRAGMELCEYEYVMGRAALMGTKWDNLMHFFDTCANGTQHLCFSKEVKVKKLLDLDKKMPEYLLLGAVIENRLLSRRELQEYLKMPPLDTQLGQLCAILEMPVQKTVSQLGSSQQALSRNLDQYVKDQSGDSAKE